MADKDVLPEKDSLGKAAPIQIFEEAPIQIFEEYKIIKSINLHCYKAVLNIRQHL